MLSGCLKYKFRDVHYAVFPFFVVLVVFHIEGVKKDMIFLLSLFYITKTLHLTS